MFAIPQTDHRKKRSSKLTKTVGKTRTLYKRIVTLPNLDIMDLYLAERRLKNIQQGRTKAIPLEEVMARYGLEG